MAVSTLDVFEKTLHKTNAWLADLEEELGESDRHRAYAALRSVLHALRDRLTTDELAQLGAQFPMLVRGMFYEGWNPVPHPPRDRSREAFLLQVQRGYEIRDHADPERLARAVFRLLFRKISGGEIEDLQKVTGIELSDLWPEPCGSWWAR